jgi:hypothetical protein
MKFAELTEDTMQRRQIFRNPNARRGPYTQTATFSHSLAAATTKCPSGHYITINAVRSETQRQL